MYDEKCVCVCALEDYDALWSMALLGQDIAHAPHKVIGAADEVTRGGIGLEAAACDRGAVDTVWQILDAASVGRVRQVVLQLEVRSRVHQARELLLEDRHLFVAVCVQDARWHVGVALGRDGVQQLVHGHDSRTAGEHVGATDATTLVGVMAARPTQLDRGTDRQRGQVRRHGAIGVDLDGQLDLGSLVRRHGRVVS